MVRDIRERETVLDDGDVLLPEKWLVRFKDSKGSLFIRQFRAPGFYEAYDKVMTYAEKLTLDILWFKEKRNCGLDYLNNNFPWLESFCTYCNKRFNNIDLVECAKLTCSSEFCSRQCAQHHKDLRHPHDRPTG